MPAPATISEFLDLVRKSNQIDMGHLDAYLDRCRQKDSLPPDPRKLASLLIRDGMLTTFQAEQFLLGKHKGFHLGGYRILERLGQGGTGTVYLAEHEVMKRRVALKVLPPAFASDPGVLERFRREAQAAGALDDPNIVRAYDFRQEGPLHFLVMEYVSGPSLEEVLRTRGALSIPVACDYVRQAALGLQHAHDVGLVHRDIKPGNLLVDPLGQVKVLDLGLARFAPEGQESVTRKFDENQVMGTADYLAPEQAIDLHNVDSRADIYSLGATLYHLVCGQPPFANGTMTQKLLWHQMKDPPRPESLRSDIPPALADVIATMMAKDPSQRYPDMHAVADVLVPFCTGESTGSNASKSGEPDHPSRNLVIPASSKSGKLASRTTIQMKADGESDTLVERSGRQTSELNCSDRRSGRTPDVRSEPVEVGSWMPVLLLVGATLFILLLVVGVICFLVFGPGPSVPPVQPVEVSERQATSNLSRPQPLPNLEGEVLSLTGPAAVERVAFSRDGQLVVSTGQDNLVRVWDLSRRREIQQFRGHAGATLGVCFDAAGARVLSASADGTARLWQLRDGQNSRQFVGHMGKVLCVLFGPDEREVITAGQDGTVRRWETATGKEMSKLAAHKDPIYGLALRPGKLEVVTASWDKTLKVLDLAAGKELRTLQGNQGLCTAVALVPGTPLAVSVGYEGIVKLWHVENGMKIADFPQVHREQLWSVAVSPGGEWAASGGADKKIALWDLRSRQLHCHFQGHTGAVNGLAFSPVSNHLVSCSSDRTIRIWGLPPAR